jgi:cohesin loading factor subunit SCC2
LDGASAPHAAAVAPVETRVRAAASQMVEVVHGVANAGWLVELLKGMLYGASDGSKAKKEAAKRRVLVLARCEALVACCVEFLLALDDDDDAAAASSLALPKSPRKAAAAAAALENGGNGAAAAASARAAKVVATLATLHVFCKASPALLVVHVETLLPYLKADNRVGGPGPEAKVCALVANMASWALPLTPPNRRDPRALATAAADLQTLTYKFGGDVVHAAVECLAVLAKVAPPPPNERSAKDADEPLLLLARVFYKVLRLRAAAWPLEPADLSKVGRGLVVLGAVCRYRASSEHEEEPGSGDEEDDDDDAREVNGAEGGAAAKKKKAAAAASALSPRALALQLPLELTARNLKAACYKCFLVYLQRDHEQVGRTALKGLSSQLVGAPRLMLRANHDGVVAAALGHASPLLRLEALVGWRDILEAEEHRVESGLAGKQMESRLTNGGGSSSDEEGEDCGDEEDGSGKGVRFLAADGKAAETHKAAAGGGIAASTKRKVQGDQDSESSVVGGVLQLHVGTVLGLLFDDSKLGGSVRSAATSLLGVMLRQGLVNPLQVLPFVVALLGDASPELRGDALRLLLVEDEKRPEFLKQRLLQGVALAYRLQTQVRGHKTTQTAPRVQCPTKRVKSGLFVGGSFSFSPYEGVCYRRRLRSLHFSCHR